MANTMSNSKPNPFRTSPFQTNPFQIAADKEKAEKACSTPTTWGTSAGFEGRTSISYNPFGQNPFAAGPRMRANLFDNVDAVGANNAAQAWPRKMPDGSMSFFGSPSSNLVIKQAAPINGVLPIEDVTMDMFAEQDGDEKDDQAGSKN